MGLASSEGLGRTLESATRCDTAIDQETNYVDSGMDEYGGEETDVGEDEAECYASNNYVEHVRYALDV